MLGVRGNMLSKVPKTWRQYRKRYIVAVSGLLVGLPLAFLAAFAWALWVKAHTESVLVVIMVIWCILWGWSAVRVIRCPCPRRGQPWLSNQDPRIGAPRRCSKCGLALYECL